MFLREGCGLDQIRWFLWNLAVQLLLGASDEVLEAQALFQGGLSGRFLTESLPVTKLI